MCCKILWWMCVLSNFLFVKSDWFFSFIQSTALKLLHIFFRLNLFVNDKLYVLNICWKGCHTLICNLSTFFSKFIRSISLDTVSIYVLAKNYVKASVSAFLTKIWATTIEILKPIIWPCLDVYKLNINTWWLSVAFLKFTHL